MPLENRLRELRSRFPRVESDAFGRPRAFFDNGAGSLVLGDAARAEYDTRVGFSAEHDSIQEESQEAGRRIQAGRRAIADLLNADDADSVVSGESTTSLLLELSQAMGRGFAGQENVVTTEYEHYANASPWLALADGGRIREVRFARFREDGRLDLDHLRGLVDDRTRVVAVSGASNLLGSVSPLPEIARIARDADAWFVVDAVHLMPHWPVDVAAIGCDFLVFSAYKLFGPYGAFLYGRPEELARLDPYRVRPAPERPPWKWERGNRDPALFAALEAVVEYIAGIGSSVGDETGGDTYAALRGRRRDAKLGMAAIREHERRLSHQMLRGLAALPRVRLFGPSDPGDTASRVPTFSFTVEGVAADRIVRDLWREAAVFVRQENFYSKAVETLGVSTVVRASLAHYNTEDEVRRFLDGLGRLYDGR
jgi:cysteine desulfurase family protein (TIGR01976 family)